MHKSYRAQWLKAGYVSNMGSAEVVQPPSASRLRAYYLTTAEFSISTIALGQIKVPRFLDLGDPFELLALKEALDRPETLDGSYGSKMISRLV